MRIVLLATAVGLLPLFVSAAVAQDAIQTTTVFGITVTQDDVINAIQENQDFWGPVRRHIVGSEFAVADVTVREETVALLKQIHDALHAQLFERDEAAAADLIEYLTMRLRRFALYRRLRSQLNDDAAFAGLIEHWEQIQRDTAPLARAERDAAVAKALAALPTHLTIAGVPEAKHAAAIGVLEQQAQCMAAMDATETGRIMIDFQVKARAHDTAVTDLLRTVAAAADWAFVTKTDGESIGRTHFVKAWDEWNALHAETRTAAKAGTTR